MKKILYLLVRLFKWALVALIGVEVMSFAVITVSNAILYGSPREGGGVRYDPYALFLNREGPRPTPTPCSEEGRGKGRVFWLFGGSTMRGETEDDDKTIPGLVSSLVNQGDGPVCYRLLNWGENSFNSLMEVKYLQKLLIERPERPDAILFYDGANECVYFTQHRSPYGHYGYRRLTALVESYDRSLFGLLKPVNAAIYASFTRELYDKIMQTLVPVEEDSGLLDRFLTMSEKRYEDDCDH